MSDGNVASGVLLVIVGVWLLLQTIAGDLPRRLLSLAGVGGSATSKGSGGIDVPLFPILPGSPKINVNPFGVLS